MAIFRTLRLSCLAGFLSLNECSNYMIESSSTEIQEVSFMIPLVPLFRCIASIRNNKPITSLRKSIVIDPESIQKLVQATNSASQFSQLIERARIIVASSASLVHKMEPEKHSKMLLSSKMTF